MEDRNTKGQINRRFSPINADWDIFTAETQSAQRQRQKILNRRLAQINADGDLRELVFCLSGDDDKQKGKRFCPIGVSRLGKILPSALKSSLSAKIGVNLRFIS